MPGFDRSFQSRARQLVEFEFSGQKLQEANFLGFQAQIDGRDFTHRA